MCAGVSVCADVCVCVRVCVCVGVSGVSDHGLARLLLPPPLLPFCVSALLLPLPVLLLLLLLPLPLPLVVLLLATGLAAADVVAPLDGSSEWPVLFAKTFLRRSSSAFRSASCRHITSHHDGAG